MTHGCLSPRRGLRPGQGCVPSTESVGFELRWSPGPSPPHLSSANPGGWNKLFPAARDPGAWATGTVKTPGPRRQRGAWGESGCHLGGLCDRAPGASFHHSCPWLAKRTGAPWTSCLPPRGQIGAATLGSQRWGHFPTLCTAKGLAWLLHRPCLRVGHSSQTRGPPGGPV